MPRTIATGSASLDDLILLRDALAHYATLSENPSARLVALQREVEQVLDERRGATLPRVFF